MKNRNYSHHHFLTGVWLFLLVVSCSTQDYSVLVGDRLELPGAVRNNRVELRSKGTRTIFWLNQDFPAGEDGINQFISELQPEQKLDFETDVFILASSDMKDKLAGLVKQAPVKIYFIDNDKMVFSGHKKQQGFLPSCIFLTTNDYVIRSVNLIKDKKTKVSQLQNRGRHEKNYPAPLIRCLK